jgi:SAM-dependent methyltransferase
MHFDEVRLSGRGNEPEVHLKRTRRMIDIPSADVLVLGVGDGHELELWQQQAPRSLTAADFHGDARWRALPRVRFARADVRALPFGDASFDLVASTALLEHVSDVDVVCGEMARVVRPGGVVFANFGPLWHTYGGAHFEGAYEHLWMDAGQLEAYLVHRAIPSEVNDGLRWLRSGMFSRLRYDDYLATFRRHFSVEHLMVAVSEPARRYRRQHPDAWQALLTRFDERDLMTFSMTVWMRPRAAGVGLQTARRMSARPRERASVAA